MANMKSEQLGLDFQLILDDDQPLSISNIIERLTDLLGNEHCHVEKIINKRIFSYEHDGKLEKLVLASITYLGGNGQHPVYKKRMQLKKWFKDIVHYYEGDKNCNVRFLGVYHYQGNLVFVEFKKDSYLKKKMNSSAAHVYTNDLFQAMKQGIFQRKDRNQNELVAISSLKLKEYLDGILSQEIPPLLEIFSKFNQCFPMGKWITAQEAITEMHAHGWGKWKETEWPGWFLEYQLDSFLKKQKVESMVKYIGSSNKKALELDFDLSFENGYFLGDLKASDVSKNEAPGNDQENFIHSLEQYDKFWYVIYEHETIKDSINTNFEATRFRTNYIYRLGEWPKNKPWDELSYHKRMKHSVRFVKMYIIELNSINYKEVLRDFHQGRQPNGDARKPKFKITKNNIDNFIIFKQDFIEEIK